MVYAFAWLLSYFLVMLRNPKASVVVWPRDEAGAKMAIEPERQIAFVETVT